ncbi:MAG TPA: DUF881 domain-containing protein [Pilimelia sp.]|nr:DUF881 domain-containing protein [Pilimelia sp.]
MSSPGDTDDVDRPRAIGSDDPAPATAAPAVAAPGAEDAEVPAAPGDAAPGDPAPGDAAPGGPGHADPGSPADTPTGPAGADSGPPDPPGRPRLSGATAAIAALLALLGFGLVAQLRNVSTDQALSTAREDDLVRILSDLEAREQRLTAEIRELEDSERQLGSGARQREAALADAARRADALGILAGTLPAEGPGLRVRFEGGPEQVKAVRLLDAVQELRNAGAEVMQLSGSGADPIRIVAASYFVEAPGGVKVDGRVLTSPYTIEAIGDATTLRSALTLPGGVVRSAEDDGGRVTLEPAQLVRITARYSGFNHQYARPAS